MMVPTIDDYQKKINFWCYMFLILAFGIGIVQICQRLAFAVLGENLTFNVRMKLFDSIIYKHIGWFDSKAKAPGILSNVLSEDISLLNGLSTETISILSEALGTVIVGMIIAFYFSWRMALVTLGMIPLVIAGGAISIKLTAKSRGLSAPGGPNKNDTSTDYYKESNALLSDLIMNYKTVISFGPKNIEFIIEKYSKLLIIPNR